MSKCSESDRTLLKAHAASPIDPLESKAQRHRRHHQIAMGIPPELRDAWANHRRSSPAASFMIAAPHEQSIESQNTIRGTHKFYRILFLKVLDSI